MQPHLIDNIEKKFGGEISKIQSYATPRNSHFEIVKSTNEFEFIKADLQSRFRSYAGILLYLTKYSRPYITNVLRQLATCMEGATLAVYKKLLRVIRFVLDTKLLCLKIKPKKDE
jgi:hypothetical protein